GSRRGRSARGEGRPTDRSDGWQARMRRPRQGPQLPGYAISRTASEARLSVSSISASSGAVDRNPASKAEGAKNAPRRRQPWKKARKRGTSLFSASAKERTGSSKKKMPHIEPREPPVAGK